MENEKEIKKKRIKRNRIIGRTLIIVSLIVFLIILLIFIIEMNRMKKIEIQDNKLITIYEENKKNPKELSKYSIRAILKIPKLDVQELIYLNKNNVYTDLEKGVVVYRQYDSLKDDVNNMSVILGHNSGLRTKKVFLKLEKMKIDDEFFIEFDGKQHKYIVKNRYIVDPKEEAPFVKEKDKNKVYLFTCYPYPINNKRLVLEGIREKI